MTRKQPSTTTEVVVPTDNTQLLSVLKLDTKVSFDDLVTVFVTKYEDELHERRERIQASLKAALVDRQNLLKDLEAKLEKSAPSKFEALFPLFKFQVTGSSLDFEKGKYQFSIHGEAALPTGVTASPGYHRRSTEASIQLQTDYLELPIAQADIDAVKAAQVVEQTLKNELLEVNAALQGIGRKARQVKSALAEKRMAAEGLSDLMESQEIKDILALK